ncbi:MAG TPA: hypothetical protein VF945_15645 [Polyangia bacterium]
MKRRAFLASLATAPLWLRRAFGDVSVGGVRAAAGAAATAAATATRPTLVFVMPRDPSERWERGGAFGELLNHGDDHDLAPLALADVVCAPAADFGVDGEPLMLFVAGGTVRAMSGPLPKGGERRMTALGNFIREVLPLHGKSVGELAAAARQRYVKKAPPGARWGRTTMCGSDYEDGPSEQVDCGMGHVPDGGRRFLAFWVGGRK